LCKFDVLRSVDAATEAEARRLGSDAAPLLSKATTQAPSWPNSADGDLT
jgi:hypothetical protein